MSNLIQKKSFGIVQMKKKAALTIPNEVRKVLRLADEGEVFELSVEDGKIILEPKALIPKDQQWYWSEEWQKAEREADEDIKAGHYTTFDNPTDAIKHLRGGKRDED
ncbi:MAG: AbrB/MazE/SpoVT family DNA-binding domain-containing protein [Desulfitobacteriaceae bacterium]